jgi:MscS family membrane protein
VEEWGEFVFLGTGITQWLFAAAYGAGGFIVGKICSGLLTAVLRTIYRKRNVQLDEEILTVLRRSLWVLVFIGGMALGFRSLNPQGLIRPWGYKIAGSLLVAVIASGIDKVIDAFFTRHIPEKGAGLAPELSALPVLRRLGKVLVDRGRDAHLENPGV